MSDSEYSSLSGLEEYQHNQKEETKARVMEAVEYLRSSGAQISRRKIAELIGVHPNTLSQPYMQEFLGTIAEFSKVKNPEEIIAEQQRSIKMLNKQLDVSRESARKLRHELDTVRFEKKTLEEKYKFLLGDYQMKVKPKITKF